MKHLKQTREMLQIPLSPPPPSRTMLVEHYIGVKLFPDELASNIACFLNSGINIAREEGAQRRALMNNSSCVISFCQDCSFFNDSSTHYQKGQLFV